MSTMVGVDYFSRQLRPKTARTRTGARSAQVCLSARAAVWHRGLWARERGGGLRRPRGNWDGCADLEGKVERGVVAFQSK